MRSPRVNRAAVNALLALLVTSTTFVRAANVGTTSQRELLSRQIIGLHSVFLESQRAGAKPSDAASVYGAVWSWKKAAFTNVCSTFRNTKLTDSERSAVKLNTYGGVFEAGNSVAVTVSYAWTVTQQALGVLNFMPLLGNTPSSQFGDPADCLQTAFNGQTLRSQVLRQLRYAGMSLSATIVKSGSTPSSFVQLVGVGDSSTFQVSNPTWNAPGDFQNKCYFADASRPAADVAAQTAAALAMLSKVFKTYGTTADKKAGGVGDTFLARAKVAYAAAKDAYTRKGNSASCTNSGANNFCIGSCVSGAKAPCTLYANSKGPQQQLFTAAAALFAAAGSAMYRTDAETYWASGGSGDPLFYNNWNNVFPQGVAIIANTPSPSGARFSRDYFRGKLRSVVANYAQCSNSGSYGGECQRTPDGNAFPKNIPWGQMGAGLNGVCLAALYNRYGIDPANSAAAKASRCFMQRQLGYTTNHKCSRSGYKCNTPGTAGFSYIVGYGQSYPRHVHSRDASYPNWGTSKPDGNTLCGALVSGPWTNPGAITDLFTDDRSEFTETEAGVDYSGSVICAFAGYAMLAEGSLSHCSNAGRSPFDGRV